MKGLSANRYNVGYNRQGGGFREFLHSFGLKRRRCHTHSQAWTVATYVLKQKIAGRKRYPFVLMLEPLFRCNLACAGCGKIQYPAHILKTELTPEECFKAVDECGTPMVSIPAANR